MKVFQKSGKNGSITHKHIWDVIKAVLRGKFIVVDTHIKKKQSDPE